MDIPVTKAKQDLCAELLTPIEKFLKFCFLLKNISIKMKAKDFYELYTTYCTAHNLTVCSSIQKMAQQMRELGFDFKPYDGYNSYRISIDRLKKVATKKKWLHELDYDQMDISVNIKRDSYFKPRCEEDDDYDYGIEKVNISVKINIKDELKQLNKLHQLRQEVINCKTELED
jgi:hypothetical protein